MMRLRCGTLIERRRKHLDSRDAMWSIHFSNYNNKSHVHQLFKYAFNIADQTPVEQTSLCSSLKYALLNYFSNTMTTNYSAYLQRNLILPTHLPNTMPSRKITILFFLLRSNTPSFFTPHKQPKPSQSDLQRQSNFTTAQHIPPISHSDLTTPSQPP
jgi:hypothetical protein